MGGLRGHHFFSAYAIVIAICIAAELRYMVFEFNSENSNISYIPHRSLDIAGTTLSAFPAEQDYTSLLLSRPIFRLDRSPVRSVSPAMAIPPPLILPKLSAIVIGLNQAFAVFSDASGRSTSVTKGSYYNNLKVLSINADGVRIATPSGTTIIGFRTNNMLGAENPGTQSATPEEVNSWPDR